MQSIRIARSTTRDTYFCKVELTHIQQRPQDQRRGGPSTYRVHRDSLVTKIPSKRRTESQMTWLPPVRCNDSW